MGDSAKPDCVVCRAMGTVLGVGGGVYVAMHAPPAGLRRFGMLFLASAFGALGIARGFNLPPFGGFFRESQSKAVQKQEL